MIDLGRSYAKFRLFSSAAMYSFLGEKDKAYEDLRLFNQQQKIQLGLIKELRYNPLFENIRHEPEFQQIVRDLEVKYQIQHEEVRKWLEENDML